MGHKVEDIREIERRVDRPGNETGAVPTMPDNPLAIVMAGPTASGKSAAALAIAERTGGVVVNADSMQVYSDLFILTARPAADETGRCEHRLYGFVDGEERYSVGRWLDAVKPVLSELKARRAPAIVTGGTGLYLKALDCGLAPIPDVPAAVRSEVAAALENKGAAGLLEELRKIDPDSTSALVASDTQRIVRAYEVLTATGHGLAHWHRQPGASPLSGWRVRRAVIETDRAALYARCNERFGQMIAHGALEEVQRLRARALDPELPVMKALGVRALLAHLAGKTNLEEACDLAMRATRQYAKRQMTWFRTQMPDWVTLPRDGVVEALSKDINRT